MPLGLCPTFLLHQEPQNSMLRYHLSPEVVACTAGVDEETSCPVIQAHQVHLDHIAVIDRPDVTRADLEGFDALITQLPGCAIGVRTADCVPVLLYDPLQKVVAAVHCGWRGTVQHLSAKTIVRMHELFGTNPTDIVAQIGPSIGPDAFQVGQEVVEAFCEAGFPMEQIYCWRGEPVPHQMQTGHHLDLWRANEWLLEHAGVPAAQIQTSRICTYSNSHEFYSARHDGNCHDRRNINWIAILP